MKHLTWLLCLALALTVLTAFAETAETPVPAETAEIPLPADAPAEEAEPRRAVVTLRKNDRIALRQTKTVSSVFEMTGTARQGEWVTVRSEEGDWAYVVAEDGEGYIMTRFLKWVKPGEKEPEPTPAPTPEPAGTPVPLTTVPPTAYRNTRAAFPAEAGEAHKVLLSFIGDLTLGSNEADHNNPKAIDAYITQYGYGYPFARVSYILEQDDLTVANLEGTLHSDNTGLTPQTKKAYNFRTDPACVESLRIGSIEAVALGNNHSIDYGEPGHEETVRVLDENGIGWFGNTPCGAKGFIFTHNGARIGFVSCYVSYWVINNGENIPRINATIEAVQQEGVNVLIAYMHGGVEYDAKHDRNQERFAQYFINKGADIVIGSHPHRLQGCQLTDGVPVFYSLGNFVFGGNFTYYNKRHNTTIRYTAILQCALSFDENNRYLGCRFNIIPCRLGEDPSVNQYQPFPVAGEEADACLKEFQLDTNKFWRLDPVIEDVGAMQMFIPARTERGTGAESGE